MSAGGHVPDVLETLAQLPNDDVFTPPQVAKAMLDVLPEHVWSEPHYRWLDPATKSGVYLREIFKRLMVGLAAWEPDGHQRRRHIFTNMLYGAATTQINGEIARRTLYQTKNATGNDIKDEMLKDFVVGFEAADGNIAFIETEHTLDEKGTQCEICHATAKVIRDSREHFAYSFIHDTYPTQELAAMKFDVIVGNPPYQIAMRQKDGKRTANPTPLYNLFVERAIKMQPRYVLMITPSRWFTGGHGLGGYRKKMLSDRHLRVIVDNPKDYDVFKQADIKGGVSYFLWDREYDGDCEFSTRIDGVITSTMKRDLRDGDGIVYRDNVAIQIVEKIISDPFAKRSLDELVSSSDPFGSKLKTNFKGSQSEPFAGSIPLIYVNKIGYIRPDQIERNHEWIDRWKVLIPKASDGKGDGSLLVLGQPITLAPGSTCTQTYLIAGTFDTGTEAENYAYYLTTKFVRLLVLQRKVSQDLIADRFKFVPWLDFSRRWSDEDLYAQFNLTEAEIDHIEQSIKPRSPILSLDSPIPATHLPGGRKYKATD